MNEATVITRGVTMSQSAKSKRKGAEATREDGAPLNSRDGTPDLPRLIASIGRNNDWSCVAELYYWSREPGILEIIRSLMAMPERTRACIEAFFSIAHDPATVAAELDAAGRLTLTSAQVRQAVAIMQFCVENEDLETPPRPN